MSEIPATSRTESHERPLSPHLSIYKPQITSITSITHRASGVFLSLGLIAFVAWLWIAAYCPEYYATLDGHYSTLWARGLMALWTLAFFYHFINGIRHLFWDMGQGLDLPSATRSGYMAIFGSIAVTAFIWYMLLA